VKQTSNVKERKMEIAREQLTETDEEIEAAFDELGYGLCVENLAFGMADEIEKFRQARKNYSDPGRIEDDTPDLLVIEKCQATRGQARRDVALIRFGEFCAIYGMDGD
jgi:hypothetical protein